MAILFFIVTIAVFLVIYCVFFDRPLTPEEREKYIEKHKDYFNSLENRLNQSNNNTYSSESEFTQEEEDYFYLQQQEEQQEEDDYYIQQRNKG